MESGALKYRGSSGTVTLLVMKHRIRRSTSEREYHRARKAYARNDFQNAKYRQELAEWLWVQEHYNMLWEMGVRDAEIVHVLT